MFGGLRLVLFRQPVLQADEIRLSIDDQVINSPVARVPWSAIRAVNLRVEKVDRTPHYWLVLTFEPSSWQPPRGLMGLRGDRRYELQIDGLNRPAREVATAVRKRWRSSRGED